MSALCYFQQKVLNFIIDFDNIRKVTKHLNEVLNVDVHEVFFLFEVQLRRHSIMKSSLIYFLNCVPWLKFLTFSDVPLIKKSLEKCQNLFMRAVQKTVENH